MKCPWLVEETNEKIGTMEYKTKNMKQCVGEECPFYKYRYDYTVKPSKEIPFCSRAEK